MEYHLLYTVFRIARLDVVIVALLRLVHAVLVVGMRLRPDLVVGDIPLARSRRGEAPGRRTLYRAEHARCRRSSPAVEGEEL
jgi:hypothetical protein